MNKDIEILIVEDSRTQIEHLTYLLEEQGYAVTPTTNGRQALKAARARKPTIIISDIMMPEMDGYALCRTIKSDAALKDIPVILVTDLNSPQDVVMGLQCCADNFITKPYDPQFLLARITQSLRNKELRANQSLNAAVEIELAGCRYTITAERHQILDLLVPTYEEAVRLNQKLRDQQKELAEQIQERTAANERLQTEIAQRKQAEETLRESEERFRTLANNMSQLAWMADEQGSIFWYNQRWFDYSGTTLEDMEGWGWQKVHHPDHMQRVVDKIRHCFQTGEVWEDTFPLRGRDGNYRWFLSRAVPIHNEEGKVLRWFGTNTDVTEQREAEEELKKNREQLEAANKELEAFSYSVSHDLRAPLRHIDGFSELLGKQTAGLDEKDRRYLKTISESAKQMGVLIDDLMAFSRIGRTALNETTVDLNRLVEDVRQSLRQDTEGRRIAWTIGPLPEVPGDPSMLRQVFANLIGNAVKYSRTREEARIEIGSRNGASGDHRDIVVFVRDNGVGFDMQYVHKLFGVFQRLHSVSEFEGTGIGLALVQRIIRRHGGRVWAEGAVNKGATFYFSLPATEANDRLRTELEANKQSPFTQ